MITKKESECTERVKKALRAASKAFYDEMNKHPLIPDGTNEETKVITSFIVQEN